ncbi:transposable element Tcb2 transposase [Trichonephila clavipes]|uniref:Transposable element Tcb2 transposase n=1 Tax=Trichonephila clavipes TaxID=2585209 RepID=A0A8X6WI34_TRICX|nr:transposable element Tcb2 transposase [Trichonephila clavipes]
MARIVRHNDESVREEYIRIGGKEVKLFTSALKAFQSNNRTVMAQRKHLDDFYVLELLVDWNGDVPRLSDVFHLPQLTLPPAINLEQRACIVGTTTVVSCGVFSDESRFSLQSDSRRTLIWRASGTRYHQENTIERYRYGGVGCFVWGGIILGSRTDLHVQSVTMTGHIYRDVILEQPVRLFRGAMGAEFLFMDDNACPHRANIVDECLQSEDITRMDCQAYSPDLNPIEHVWDMLGR